VNALHWVENLGDLEDGVRLAPENIVVSVVLVRANDRHKTARYDVSTFLTPAQEVRLRLCQKPLELANEKRPRQDSNLRHRLRRPVLYPLSYGGGSC
jgi:hypothetical protein